MSNLKALIFDVDGTLADTERDGHRVAFNRAFQTAGLPWHWDEKTYGELLIVTGGKERIRHFVDRRQPPRPGEDLDELINTLHLSKTKYFVELAESGAIPLRPGVQRLISEARSSHIKLGIATTTTFNNVVALLHATLGPDSTEWFEVIAAGDIVARKKPAPDIYLHALKAMNLKASECVALEDSKHGLRSATQAGLKTVVTVNDYTCHEDFSGATLVLDQLGEPDSAFKVIAGDAGKNTFVDVSLLAQISSDSNYPEDNPRH